MKKIIVNILVSLVIGGLAYLIFDLYNEYKEVNAKYEAIGKLKRLNHLLDISDYSEYSIDSIGTKKKLFVKYSTGCNHCNDQMEILKSLREELDLYHVFMLSYNSIKTIDQFVDRHKVRDDSIFHFFADTGTETEFFQNSILPALYIYNEEGELTYYHEGVVPEKQLREVLISRQND